MVEPPSGSTSFHLWWLGLDERTPYVEAAVTLEVLQRPVSPRLYFWALQASFTDGHRTFGAAHTGLQWNPRHGGSTAVNWGGYAQAADVTSVLEGSLSTLPGRPDVDDRNTRDYPWSEGVPYRFRIHRVEAGWRSSVTDLSSGETTVIRDLYAAGERLTGFVMWSELFCACTDPQVVVRWSDPTVSTAAGEERSPTAVRCTFPAGGCRNVDSVSTAEGLVQIAGTTRTARDLAVLPVSTPG
ncbi:MAG TPA: hypothetical protein VF855_14995 [Acidimicrobiales bacterium]